MTYTIEEEIEAARIELEELLECGELEDTLDASLKLDRLLKQQENKS